MDEKEILAYCEAVITEVDIELMNWHHKIDLMAFIGQDVPLVIYTGEARVEVGTARLIHDDGALKMTGEITAELSMFSDQPGHHSLDSYSIGFDTLDKQLTAVSLAPKGAKAHFRIDESGTIEQFVDLRATSRNTELPSGLEGGPLHSDKLREQIHQKVKEALEDDVPPPLGWHGIPAEDVINFYEQHPFFRNEQKEND